MYGNYGTATRQKANKISCFFNETTHHSERDAQRKRAADTRSECKTHGRSTRKTQRKTARHTWTQRKASKRNYASQRDTLNAARRDDYATQPATEREAANAARREKYDASRKQQLERRRAKRSLSDICTCTSWHVHSYVRHTMDVIEEPNTAPAAPSGVPAALPEAHKQHLQNQPKENKKQEARLNDKQLRWLNNEVPGPLHEQQFAKTKGEEVEHDAMKSAIADEAP